MKIMVATNFRLMIVALPMSLVVACASSDGARQTLDAGNGDTGAAPTDSGVAADSARDQGTTSVTDSRTADTTVVASDSADTATSASDSATKPTDTGSPATDSATQVTDTGHDTGSNTPTDTGSATPDTTTCTPPTGGTSGFATRFWDCCKPSCSWTANVSGTPANSCSAGNTTTNASTASACSNGSAYACYNFAPWAVSNTLAYGFAAFNAGNCGDCYQLQFTGTSNATSSDQGSAAICGKTMIVQKVNTGGIASNQFDLMIPGGGVGANNACSTEWGTSNIGQQYGGFLATCQAQSNDYATYKACTQTFCSTVFSSGASADLLAGCDWFVTWYEAANNPNLVYTPVACPAAITSVSGMQ